MTAQTSSLMELAQAGLFVEPGNHAHYLEALWPVSLSWADLKAALNLARQPIDEVYLAIGFGADAWQRLQPNFTPSSLTSFVTLNGQKHSMPSTQGDLWFWIHGEDRGAVMEAVLQIQAALGHLVEFTVDISGFKNKEARDLTGFVDGTENPADVERGAVAQIPAGELGAGGSYVFSQLWQHNLAAFNQLKLHEQEQVFGRTKQDNIELEGDDLPPTAHISRTDVSVDGEAQEIYRRSTPYGNAQHHGLYFLAFACHPNRIAVQLDSMLGNTADGLSDRMLDFTQALTGAYWFMPSQQDLDELLAL